MQLQISARSAINDKWDLIVEGILNARITTEGAKESSSETNLKGKPNSGAGQTGLNTNPGNNTHLSLSPEII